MILAAVVFIAAESYLPYVPGNIKLAQRQTRPSADEVIRHASSFLGTRYVWGSCEIPPGLDCSGFMIRVWSDMGYALPRVSRMQAMVGLRVDPEQLQPADLLFFTTDPGGSTITHVGMYIGKGEFIHAAMGSMRVVVSSLSGYFRARFSHARRILPLGPGYVVEADQSQPIGKGQLPSFLTAPPTAVKVMPTKKERDEAQALLADVVLPETGVIVPDFDEVQINDWTIEDEDLARQLLGVDTSDPNQFEHAGQTPPAFFSLSTNMFAGAAVPQGPRYLTREEHAVSLHAGGVTLRGDSTRGAFYLAPELNLHFDNAGVRANFGFAVPYAFTDGSVGFQWATTPTAWRDYTRVLRLLQYGEKEAALYFALDRFATTTMGHGHLVRNISASLASLYVPGAEFGHVPLTWHGEINLEAAAVQTQVDDVLDPRLVTARLALRPWQLVQTHPKSDALRDLTFALEYGIDMGPGRTRAATNLLSTDIELRAWHTRVHQTDVYVGSSFAITGGATRPALAMGKGTVGTLWRFKLGASAAHSLRARLELGFGRARDTWIDNFEYLGAPRSTSSLSTLAGLGYRFKQVFDLGATYVPALPAAFNTTPEQAAHKLESHLGVTNVAIDPRVRLNMQVLHQMLLYSEPTSPNAHYLLADVHLIALRFLKTGVVVRKPLSTNFERWDVMLDVAAELPF